MKKSEAPVTGNNIKFPRTNRNVRVLETTYSRSKSKNNPMITIDCELAKNDPEIIGDKTVDLNGLKLTYYIPFTKKNAARIFELYERLQIQVEELPFDDECTDANHPDEKLFDGLMFNAQIGCEEDVVRSAPKPERIDPNTGATLPAQKPGEGDPVKDPTTGKEISRGFKPTSQFSDILFKVEDGVA